MFGDWGWNSAHAEDQRGRMKAWLRSIVGCRLVVIEFGAGTAIPTVRDTCAGIADRNEATLIRINPRETEVPEGQISLPMGAYDALGALDERVKTPRS
jgi:hypothetical protein